LILQLPEQQVIRKIQQGQLSDVSAARWARLDPREVLDEAKRLVDAELLSPLVLWIWQEVVEGSAPVPRQPRHRRPPTPLDYLCSLRNAR